MNKDLVDLAKYLKNQIQEAKNEILVEIEDIKDILSEEETSEDENPFDIDEEAEELESDEGEGEPIPEAPPAPPYEGRRQIHIIDDAAETTKEEKKGLFGKKKKAKK